MTCQGPGNGCPLLLTAGKMTGIMISLVGDADFGQKFLCFGEDLFFGALLDINGASTTFSKTVI